MAKWCALLVVATFAVAGCQQQPPVSMVDNLPVPNFGGPAFAERPAARPAAPPPVAVLPARPQPRSSAESANEAVPASWIPRVAPRRWYWVVIHHSATATGSAAEFDKMHRAKGWDELGYDFVIGNGTGSRDGQIEVGPRWPIQKWGAHDKTPGNQFNEHGIGICLVGNFDLTYPTHAQIRSLERLVAYLMRTYHIPADHVLGHGETKATHCPGRHMNVAMIRRVCAQMVANVTHGYRAEGYDFTPGQQLLADRRRSR